MADVIVTLKVMPESVDVNLNNLETKVKEVIKKFGGDVGKVEVEEVAFGLKAVKLLFVLDENKGIDDLEKGVNSLDEVRSAEVSDVRRAIG